VVGHIDCDAMFAAIECLLNPRLAGQPVIVGADPQGGQGRGVVATCSYPARVFGVRSAMPISEAYRRCPQGVFLPVRHEVYRAYGDRVMALLRETTGTLQRVSIDECYVDWTAHGPAAVAVAEGIRARVRQEIGLTISVGIAATRLVAKIASDLRKPDALVVCAPGEEAALLGPLPVGRIPGVGPRTQDLLRAAEITTIGDIQRADPTLLRAAVGARRAEEALRAARGQDDSPVVGEPAVPLSFSQEHTWARDEAERREVWQVVQRMADTLARRLEARGWAARQVGVKLRTAAYETTTRDHALRSPVLDAAAIAGEAALLIARHWDRRPLRLIGVRVAHFVPSDAPYQLPLPLPAGAHRGAAPGHAAESGSTACYNGPGGVSQASRAGP